MEGFESTEMEDAEPEFTLKEIIAMERLFKDVGEKSLSQEFCQELVDNFSQSKYRAEKPAIKWEQVQSWFQDKQKQIAAKVSTLPVVAPEEFNPPSDWALTISVPESLRKTKAERVAGLSELAFEAKSFKDFAWLASIVGPTRLLIAFKKTSCRGITSDIKKANGKHRLWYDVAAFLNYRVVHTGELEVRVRFSGFSYDQDEWVNVKRGVRERSIPLEPSECHRVKVGDPVLCFRETDVRAIYCDAFILDIQRSTHDTLDCTCQFLVRYTYDNAEATVPLSSVCCRPT